MSLGKVYYDPKHAAGFGSVAELVMAVKIRCSRLVVGSGHVYFGQTCKEEVPYKPIYGNKY
jgi:hypothetical protein